MIDGDLRTLHIRCGSDIRARLGLVGFTGDFLEYSDPVHDGPLPDVPDLAERRADILAARAGLTVADCLRRLREAERGLESAHHYERVVLWFEHDSYDQLILARCLSRLADGPLPPVLDLICIDRHPEVARFNGLGQLSPAALAGLWPARRPVTAEQIALGRSIWTALRQTDPTDLQAIARTGTPALPVAAAALWRHLRELPGVQDGLSLTQRLILTILSEAPHRIGRIFEAMVNGREPLVFMGDVGLLQTVEAMALTHPPVLTIDRGEKPFPRVAAITETGAKVLAGTMDLLALGPAERWVGTVRADGAWRWDDSRGQVVWTSGGTCPQPG